MKKAPVLMLAIFAGCLLIGCSKGDDSATATAGAAAPTTDTKAGAVGTQTPSVLPAGRDADKMTGTKAAGK